MVSMNFTLCKYVKVLLCVHMHAGVHACLCSGVDANVPYQYLPWSLSTLVFEIVSEPKFTDSSKWAPQLAPGIHLSPSRECSACRYDAITPR